MYLIHL